MTARTSDSGVALWHVLLMLGLVSVASGGLSLVAGLELAIARRHRLAQEASYAARGALAVTLQEIGALPEWGDALSGASTAAFARGSAAAARPLPGGDAIVICCGPGSRTGEIDRETGLAWRPFGWGSLEDVMDAAPSAAFVLVAWAADDPDDGDGDVGADANGRLLVRAEAHGPQGVRQAVEVLVERPPPAATGERPPGVSLLAWREPR